jgi:hypothetical protein
MSGKYVSEEDTNPELLVPTEFPEDEFPDPPQEAVDLGKEDDQ